LARPPRIFIGHSAHDPVASDFLESLHARLSKDEKFDPLVDRFELRKMLGKNWRETLHMWMELCNGDVVLVKRARSRRRVLGPPRN
jgi:hypothetical protein